MRRLLADANWFFLDFFKRKKKDFFTQIYIPERYGWGAKLGRSWGDCWCSCGRWPGVAYMLNLSKNVFCFIFNLKCLSRTTLQHTYIIHVLILLQLHLWKFYLFKCHLLVSSGWHSFPDLAYPPSLQVYSFTQSVWKDCTCWYPVQWKMFWFCSFTHIASPVLCSLENFPIIMGTFHSLLSILENF